MDFRLWLEGLEDVIQRVAAILSPDQPPTKKIMAQARRIVDADPGKKQNKLGSVALAKWVKKGYELEEHLRDVSDYYNLKKEFRQKRDSLDRESALEIHRILPRNLDDFEEPSDLQAINQKINALLGKEAEMTGLDRLKIIGTENGYVMYEVPRKSAAPKGFHPDQIPAFQSAHWCVVGGHYGGYGGGPYYAVLKDGKFWSHMIIPGILPDNVEEGLRDGSNSRMLTMEELSRIKGLFQKVMPIKKIVQLVNKDSRYLPLLLLYPDGAERAQKILKFVPWWHLGDERPAE